MTKNIVKLSNIHNNNNNSKYSNKFNTNNNKSKKALNFKKVIVVKNKWVENRLKECKLIRA